MMSNHRGMPGGSTDITPIMWATGSLSITVNVKTDSSNEIGSKDGLGLEIHSMWSLVVDDFWGRPLSTALIYEIWAEGMKRTITSDNQSLDCFDNHWVSFKYSKVVCEYSVCSMLGDQGKGCVAILTGVRVGKANKNPQFPNVFSSAIC